MYRQTTNMFISVLRHLLEYVWLIIVPFNKPFVNINSLFIAHQLHKVHLEVKSDLFNLLVRQFKLNQINKVIVFDVFADHLRPKLRNSLLL